MPKVSVLMPVYNGEKYVKQAIDSVLSQTYSDFELIVVDDGSTDNSAEIIKTFNDKRLVYIPSVVNLGLAGARNRAIEVSSGDYLAWLDCDDISLPNRLRKQVKLLDLCPNVGLCGTWVRTLGLGAEQIWRYPSDSGVIRARMLFDDPLATSAAMIRRNCLDVSELQFDMRFPPAEDYELWERISRANLVCNIPEVLTRYRIHSNQISKIKRVEQRNSVWKTQLRLLNQLHIDPSDEEKLLHLDIGVGWHFPAKKVSLDLTEDWLIKLANANETKSVFPHFPFLQVLESRWYLANLALVRRGQESWRRFSKSSLVSSVKTSLRRQVRLFISSI